MRPENSVHNVQGKTTETMSICNFLVQRSKQIKIPRLDGLIISYIIFTHHSRLFNRRLSIFCVAFLVCGITVVLSIRCFYQLCTASVNSLSQV